MKLGRARIGHEAPPPVDVLARLRVEAARRNEHWTEIPDDLVPRPHRYLVSASTDTVYRVYRGATFSGAQLEFARDRPLSFVVRGGDVVALERLPETWSQMLERRLQAGARR